MKECDMLMTSSADFAKKGNQIRKAYNLFNDLEAQKKIDTSTAWKKIDKKIKRDQLIRTARKFVE